MKLEQVHALVTGGARGMGRTFVAQLAAGGARVAFCDVDPEGVAETSEALGVPGFVCDVSDEEAVDGLIRDAAAALGTLDVLVNNAGITRDGLLIRRDRKTGEVTTLSKARWDAVVGVNLTGPFLCTRAFARRCVEQGVDEAVVVNLSSISRAGNVGQSNYAAAKAGLASDTVVWARELARYGIRVAAIAPGFVDTPMVAAMRPDVLDKLLELVPLRRLGQPEELWQALRFVIECGYFTGRVLEVDGGLRL